MLQQKIISKMIPTSRLLLLLLICSQLLFSCDIIENKTEVVQNEKVEDSIRTEDYNFSQIDSKNFKLLQGSWQSLDDPKSKVLFEGNLKIDIYDDKIIGEKYQFSVGEKCTNTTSKASAPEKDRYLVITEFDQCFYIVELDDNTLGLSLVGKGSILRYTRIKD